MTPEFSRSKDQRRVSVSTGGQDGLVRISVTARGIPAERTLHRTMDLTESDFEWLIQSAGPAVLMALRRDRPPAD